MWQRRRAAVLATAALIAVLALARVAPARAAPALSPPATSSVEPAEGLGVATATASQPAVPTEPATPRDALKIFAAAMRDGDAARLRSVVLIGNPAESRMLGAVAGLAGALARLSRAASKRFGDDEAGHFTDDTTTHFASTLARIDSAEVAIEGDNATIHYRGPGQTVFSLRRVTEPGGAEARWKVPMTEIAPGADAAALDQRLEELTVQRRIVEELADEIADGKYKNADAAKDAWRSKIMQILPTHPPTTAPATHAATRMAGG